MENHIKDLLNKYLSGRINKGELEHIRHSVSQMSNHELDKVLSEVWDEYDGMKKIDDFDLILKKIQPKKKVFRFGLVASVAASILICTLIGIQIYFYKDNRRLNEFIHKDIVMNVESGERTNITLPDGTKVSLNAGTTISYSGDYGLVSREVKLDGEAFMDVVKDREKPFRVNTEYVGIEVLGTKFNINAYSSSELIETTLIGGSIKLTTKGDRKQTVVMSPSEKAIYNKKTDQLSITKQSSTHFETAWLEGKLVFRSAEFKDVLSKLEKRYGVNIEIVNMEKYPTDSFYGTFKEDYVNGVLKILQLHYDFTYTDNDGDIKIYLK